MSFKKKHFNSNIDKLDICRENKMPTLDFDIGILERMGQELHPTSGRLADTEVDFKH